MDIPAANDKPERGWGDIFTFVLDLTSTRRHCLLEGGNGLLPQM